MDTTQECVGEQPLWSRANDTLNAIRDDLMTRAATIEGEMKRLQDEYSHIQNTLNRIAPPAPMPAGNAIPPETLMGGATRRW